MREEILDFVGRNPGASSQDIARAMTNAPSARNTLTVLVDLGLLIRKGPRRDFRYYVPALGPQTETPGVRLTPQRVRIVEFVQLNPGTTGPAIAREIGHAAYQQLHMLVMGGHLMRTGTQHHFRYYTVSYSST